MAPKTQLRTDNQERRCSNLLRDDFFRFATMHASKSGGSRPRPFFDISATDRH